MAHYFFQPRQSLTSLFIVMAVVVALLSVLFSNKLVKELENEERSKMEIWTMATESMGIEEDMDMSLILMILESNFTIPIILFDKNTGRLLPRNLKIPEKEEEALFLRSKMEEFGRKNAPIELQEMNQLLYYDDSMTLKMLQRYPYFQLLVISLFTGLAFFALNRSQRAQRDKVWVGLSKETAHQLGTPISSLMAWKEYMDLKGVDPLLLTEIEKDISRLQMIAERFSKIGSVSGSNRVDLRETIHRSLAYLEKRISREVVFHIRFPEHPVWVDLNEPLIGWVIENLVKNGIDAMQGQGDITFALSGNEKRVFLDISDTGKGLPKSKFKTVFSPGYTTKERGWGLGLTLVKRIVEENHKGKIFVRKSEPGKGATFRIVLKRS